MGKVRIQIRKPQLVQRKLKRYKDESLQDEQFQIDVNRIQLIRKLM
jgi:hypothetical protein